MDFRHIRIEFALPMFWGIFCSLILCALAAVSLGFFPKPAESAAVRNKLEMDDIHLLFSLSEKIPDPVLEYYHREEYREWVIDFFSALCSNREIAYAVLRYSDEYEVPPALAFALCWEESRFNPGAINRRNRDGSIDRGLFQLNNRSFPNLETLSFFSVDSNARFGVGHLRDCLDEGGSEIAALAMYNAGAGRVRSMGAPEVTLNYINRIMENRRKIESRFHSQLIIEEEHRIAQEAVIAAP